MDLDASEREYLRKTLLNLKSSIEDMETKRMKSYIRELEEKTWDEKNSIAIESLSRLILLGEFDEAVLLIGEMIDEMNLDNRAQKHL